MKNIKKVLEAKGIDRLFAYSRKSRDIDNEGLEKHHRIIQEMADKLGMPVTIYQEVASSETLDRPQLNLLRKEIQAKKVRCLIIYRMDRISRKVTDTERIIKEFSFNELILIEANREKIVNYSEILGIKLEAMMSDLYQEQAKIVLLAGRRKSVQLYGNHLGEPCLGYSYNRDSKKLDPSHDAWIVKEVYTLYLQGYSTTNISIKLNQMGLLTRKGCLFNSTGVNYILKNEKYIGTQIHGKTEWFKGTDGKILRKAKPQAEWIVYVNAHEPLVQQDDFDRVQALLEKNRPLPKSSQRHTHILTGVVMCGKCGQRMSMIKRTYPNKTVHNIRSCTKNNFMTGVRCGNKGIDGLVVEDFIVKSIFGTVKPAILRMNKAIAKNGKCLKRASEGQELDDLFKQERALTKQMDKLIDMQLEFKTDRVAVKMKQVESQLAFITTKIEMLAGEASVGDEFTWVDKFLQDAENLINFPFNFRGMSDEDKNIFIKRYIDYVKVLDGQITEIRFAEEVEKLLQLEQTLEEKAV